MSWILDPRYQLDRAVEILRRSEPLGVPTETVYGLAADALAPQALARIFELKARPTFDPLIVHVASLFDVARIATFRFDLEERLARAFWPGPLTLLLPKTSLVPDLATAGLPTVAVRCPAHAIFRNLIEIFASPLAAPSANRFGRISPTSAPDVVQELGPYGLEGVVDGGRCEWGVESTIVQVQSESLVRILRPGALALDNLREWDRRLEIEVATASTSAPGMALEAPGSMESHYAPRCPLFFNETSMLPDEIHSEAATLLSFGPEMPAWARQRRWARHACLSPRRSDREAATALFARLRELDEVELIVAESLPDEGLGLAVNDRLRRAGAGYRNRAKILK